jgi:hypothetical protein
MTQATLAVDSPSLTVRVACTVPTGRASERRRTTQLSHTSSGSGEPATTCVRLAQRGLVAHVRASGVDGQGGADLAAGMKSRTKYSNSVASADDALLTERGF